MQYPQVTHAMRHGEWLALTDYEARPKCDRCRAPLADTRYSLCLHCRHVIRERVR